MQVGQSCAIKKLKCWIVQYRPELSCAFNWWSKWSARFSVQSGLYSASLAEANAAARRCSFQLTCNEAARWPALSQKPVRPPFLGHSGASSGTFFISNTFCLFFNFYLFIKLECAWNSLTMCFHCPLCKKSCTAASGNPVHQQYSPCFSLFQSSTSMATPSLNQESFSHKIDFKI